MFQAIAKKPPRNPDRASARNRYDDDAIATGRPDTLNPTAARTSIRPTPTRAVSRPVISAATSTPIDPIENANPMPSAERPARGSRTG